MKEPTLLVLAAGMGSRYGMERSSLIIRSMTPGWPVSAGWSL